MQGQSELCQPWYRLQSAEMAQVFVFISLFLRLTVFVLILLLLRFTVFYHETLSIYWQKSMFTADIPEISLSTQFKTGIKSCFWEDCMAKSLLQ